MRFLTPLAAALLLSVPAASQANDVAPATTAPVKPAKPKKFCREMPAKTGSHMGGGRVCKTAAQWRELDQAEGDNSTMAGTNSPTHSSQPSAQGN